MGVSIRTMVSHIPKSMWRQYCEQYKIAFAEPMDWAQEDNFFASSLENAINALSPNGYEPIRSHLESINVLASERGIKALINASKQPIDMAAKLKAMENAYHRAMAIFLENQDLFMQAEELLFADFKAEGRSWQHYAIQTQATVDDITADDANAFAFEVAKIIHHHFDKRDECCGEVYKHYADGTRQISVYVNDYPSCNTHVQNSQLCRVDHKKSIVAAIIYDPRNKHVCTVIDGGKKNHELVCKAFAKTILRCDVTEFVPTAPVYFAIEKFASRPQAPMLRTKPEHNIEVVRVRKLDIYTNTPFKHILTLDTMTAGKDSDLYSSRTFFDRSGVLYEKYRVLHVVLSFHFYPKKVGGCGQVIHVSLKRTASDLHNLKEADRILIEGYLKEWGILEHIATEQPLIKKEANMFDNRYAWLVQLFETGEHITHADAMLQNRQVWFDELIKEKAFVHSGNVSSLLCPECDEPHDIAINPRTFEGYCVETGYVAFESKQIMQYQASPQWVITAIRKSLGITATDKIKEIMTNTCWRIGSVRLAKKLRPLFFCRNYAECKEAIERNIAALADETGIVLLTSPHKQNPEQIAGHRTASLMLCLSDKPNKSLLNIDVLERMWGNRPAEKGRLTHAPDFRIVTLDGRTHHFPGELQRKFVKRLIELHNEGVTSAKTSDVMSAIGGENTRRIGDLFKGHKT